ncbi:ABC transporter ATP-binding protein [Micromonospora sp. NBC_01813]|uniref:ABC transporter ATP-binding protein n=1 Tax=Micromonospora sp. NBC_01813 TaxID=2975988 RepID=UPI002DDA064D|nr:ABC transporter ATP-binding protein [Micromonospora sp. NBC_01813]WSA10144.1 ABC transporter ATP-binding protein [Micromonospora sp. NBC_01813]
MAPTLTARVRRQVCDVDFAIDTDRAPVTVLFGPSGAGKTTLLRCLAGLDRPERGSLVQFGDQTWDTDGRHLPTRHRRIGYLFQDHALFPHLSVAGNVGYGLHRLPRRQRPARVRAALAAAGAAHLLGRATIGLSGGEAQRVALARAIAPAPRLLLLDEPLSALDTPTRERLGGELRRLLLATGVPAVIVTHDRAEAMTLGDRIAVMIEGRLHQHGPVDEVFNRPATAEVATVVGIDTILTGKVTGQHGDLTHVEVAGQTLRAAPHPALAVGEGVLVCIRGDDIALELPGPRRTTSPRNRLPAIVTAVQPAGPVLRVGLDAGVGLTAYVTRPTGDDLELRPGRRVTAVIKATAIQPIPYPGGAADG